MLEVRKYSKHELTAILGTRSVSGIKRRLYNHEVSYEVIGRGEAAVFNITEIANPFKIYCITELGFCGQTDFWKLRNYLFIYFNDAEFRSMPNEVQESRMRLLHKDVSRQTIANYLSKLNRRNLIEQHTGDFMYYFAYKDKQRIVDKDEYKQAWRQYWIDVGNGYYSGFAINHMIEDYGGVARKQEIPTINGIYNKEIEILCDYIQIDIEHEIELSKI